VKRRYGGLLAACLLGAVAASGCTRTSTPTRQTTPGDPNVLTVYATCAFAPAVESARRRFEAANPGKSLKVEAGDPDTLVREIEGGAAADVFISLGESEHGLLEREGFMDGSFRRSVGAFAVVLATPASKPSISGPAALTSSSVKSMVMPTPGITSLGTDAKRLLSRLGVWEKLQGKLVVHPRALDAMAALSKGEADAGVMYHPCPLLKLPGKIPPDSVRLGPSLATGPARPIQVEMGIHKNSPRTQLAQKFIAFMRSDEAMADLAPVGVTAGDEQPETATGAEVSPGEPDQPRPQ